MKTKFKDIPRIELIKFVKKLIYVKSEIGIDNCCYSSTEWRKKIYPLEEFIISLFLHNFNSLGEEILTREKFITALALSIATPLKIAESMNWDEHILEPVINGETSITELLEEIGGEFSQKEDMNIAETVQKIAIDIFKDCIMYLGGMKYIDDFEGRPINYHSLLDFLDELISAKKTNPNSIWKHIDRRHIESSLRSLSRGYMFDIGENKNEVEEPGLFASSIVEILSIDILSFGEDGKYDPITNLNGMEILKNGKEVEDLSDLNLDIIKDEIPKTFKIVKSDIGPGLVWWIEKHIGKKIELKDIDDKTLY